MAVRVLAIPHVNSYVRAASPAGSLASVTLTDRQASGWDLHPAFGSGWVTRHRGEFDLVHLHFGFERCPLAQLGNWVQELADRETPLVLTVHDLRNPHAAERTYHDRQLQLLLSAADRVVTLTPGAAAEIEARSGRRAEVIAHPGLLPGAASNPVRRPTVGVYLKQRAQVVDPDAVVLAALAGAEARDAVLRVDAQSVDIPSTRALAAAGRLELHPAGYLDDAAFADYLGGLAVSVLPYRFGTHSGWLEACHDLGTTVVAPDCGYYAEQWDQVLSYGSNEHTGLDAASLTAAVTAALDRPAAAPADTVWRREQQQAVRAAHAAIYGALSSSRVAA